MARSHEVEYRNDFFERYGSNVYSQNGEDGLVLELLRRLGITGGWVVESGAWDGVHCSNTFVLVESGNFKALYIEADDAKFRDLLATAARHPGIVPVQAMLRPGEDTLGDLMRQHGVEDPAVLSIDIDSWDYDVWANLSGFRPAVVVIEVNSAAHATDWKIHGRDGWASGTSFLPMLLLGAEKGYRLVAHCGNMVFVRADLWPRLRLPHANPLSFFHLGWMNDSGTDAGVTG